MASDGNSGQVNTAPQGSQEAFICSLCKNLMTNPLTLSQCLHSYCEQCLHSVPKTEQDGQKGWLCSECETFSTAASVRKNDFIADLMDIISSGDKELKCQQCLNSSADVIKKCKECKTELCESCLEAHQRIPMLKDHQFIDITDQRKVVDKLLYCELHPNKVIEYNCKSCNIPICSVCNLTNHNTHKIETITEAVKRLLPEMEANTGNVHRIIDKIQKQIDSFSVRINETKESYAAAKTELDVQVENIIYRLKALKLQKEAEINDQEVAALNVLYGTKHRLENQQSKLKNICRVAQLTSKHSVQTTLLTEFEMPYDLLNKVKELALKKKDDELYEILLPSVEPDPSAVEEPQKNLCEVKYQASSVVIDTSGVKWMDNRFMCDDFSVLMGKELHHSKGIKIVKQWCNGLSCLGEKLWVGFPNDSKLHVYNDSGDLLHGINTDKVTAIRMAGNGDFIAAGLCGLFLTNEYCSEWKELCFGKYSDLCVHGKKFTALRYDIPKVVTFELKFNEESKTTQWTEVSSFGLPPKHFSEEENLSYNSKLVVTKSNEVIISKCGDENKRAVFNFTDGGVLKHMRPTGSWAPLICGQDKMGKIMIASFNPGRLYVIDAFQDLTTLGGKQSIDLSIDSYLWDAVIDSRHQLWTLQGHMNSYRLVKYHPAMK